MGIGFNRIHPKAGLELPPVRSEERKSVGVLEPVTKETPQSITWQEIATADYTGYIKNLRALGCPEKTIRWIIASEMVKTDSVGAVVQQVNPEALNSEQQNQLQQLLGSSVSKSEAIDPQLVETRENGSSSIQLAAGDVSLEEDTAPKMPLVLLAQQPGSGLILGPEQQAAMKSLQKSFTSQLTSQNPSDQVYLQQWVAAQPTSDEIFHSQFGDAAYAQMLQQRALQASGDFHF